jgi:DNA-binding CsgD family transcriptional regulator
MGEKTASPQSLNDVRLRGTQILGLCFYWAWVYLSFNTTTSMNWKIEGSQTLLWIHLVSNIVGVVVYALVIGFSRYASELLARRRTLIISGLVMALGTALDMLPVFGDQFALIILGGVLTGVGSCSVVLFWGMLYSDLSARNIVISTAASFFFANVIYLVTAQFPGWPAGLITTALPICAVLLFPEESVLKRYLGDGIDVGRAHAHIMQSIKAFAHRAADAEHPATADGSDAAAPSRPRRIFPVGKLPWRIAAALFVIMFVYGGVRVLLGTLDTSQTDSSLVTGLLVFAVTIVFMIWGFVLQGRNVGLGYVYKIALPLLATVLLVIVIFKQTYVAQLSLLATACNVTIEILTWMLLADLARTTRTPTFLVFALGRGAAQLGMFDGQAIAWVCIDYMQVFAIVSIFALMLVTGFMFREEDTVLVFEAPSRKELDQVTVLAGQSMEGRLESIADEHGLTPRETEIFIYWATGHGSRYIQEKLVISAATVKTHVHHIYEKCGVHSRAEIIALLEGIEEEEALGSTER